MTTSNIYIYIHIRERDGLENSVSDTRQWIHFLFKSKLSVKELPDINSSNACLHSPPLIALILHSL